ncbi:MAG: zf-HC2 domain-containing protein [Actinomycetota bacterium]|nr:zf-HC2 domain-containing protein [Actinomycetota bacterium]
MNRLESHERFEELAAGYALVALEPQEEEAFVAHLATCAPCGRAVALHNETLAHLAYAEVAEPPAALLEAIRAGVQASGRPAVFPESPAVTSLEGARNRKRQAFALRGAPLWASVAAAVALVISLGIWNTSLRDGQTQQSAWQSRVSQVVSQLGLTSAQQVQLKATDGTPVVLAVVHGREVSLVIDGLTRNDVATSTYVLWQKSRFGDLRAVGAFDVTAAKLDVVPRVMLLQNPTDVVTLMVTKERGRTAPALPAAPVVAAGNV